MESEGSGSDKDSSSSSRRSRCSQGCTACERCLPFVPADVRPWGAGQKWGDPLRADVRFINSAHLQHQDVDCSLICGPELLLTCSCAAQCTKLPS